MVESPVAQQRLDKWLWHTRFVKTRSLAQKLITSGAVRIDREKIVSPSKLVKTGQVLTITLPREVKIIRIDGFAEKRGPFKIAQLLYTDLTPPPVKEDKSKPQDWSGIETEGRPSKHDRKKILALKRNFAD